MPAIQFEIWYVAEDGRWDNACEGPWTDAQQAIDFAKAEVASPWVVCDSQLRPIAFGDADTCYPPPPANGPELPPVP